MMLPDLPGLKNYFGTKSINQNHQSIFMWQTPGGVPSIIMDVLWILPWPIPMENHLIWEPISTILEIWHNQDWKMKI
jgi:hypothetical protein